MIYIVKPNADSYDVVIPATNKRIFAFSESDCVPVDFNELLDEYNEYLCDVLGDDETTSDYMFFSEYLQERMK